MIEFLTVFGLGVSFGMGGYLTLALVKSLFDCTKYAIEGVK